MLKRSRRTGFTRDVSNVGHYGTGDLEITLVKPKDLERAIPLIKRSYEEVEVSTCMAVRPAPGEDQAPQ